MLHSCCNYIFSVHLLITSSFFPHFAANRGLESTSVASDWLLIDESKVTAQLILFQVYSKAARNLVRVCNAKSVASNHFIVNIKNCEKKSNKKILANRCGTYKTHILGYKILLLKYNKIYLTLLLIPCSFLIVLFFFSIPFAGLFFYQKKINLNLSLSLHLLNLISFFFNLLLSQ